jgi:acetyl-CoA C-acetyltransferase
METSRRRVAIVGGTRIPFARANTAYGECGNQDLLTGAFRALVQRYSLHDQTVGEVAAGAVIKHSRDWNLARECTLGSGLRPETPAYDIQRACGTSLTAAIQVAHRIAAGEIECGIAGGVDSASDIPLGYGRNLQQAVLRLSRSRSVGEKLSSIGSVRLKDLKPTHPGIAEPRTGMSMGEHCEQMAKEWKIGRQEQDELALASHRNAAAAWKAGFFDDLVIPFQDLKHDNNVRADTSLERLASLRSAFSKDGTLTAGNSSPLTDGAACVLLASEDWLNRKGLQAQCFLAYSETAAVDFVGGKEGMLMAPAYAVPRMLERAGLRLQDFDIYEIHEAFAAQVLCTLKAWESEEYCRGRLGRSSALGKIDTKKLNPKGSSVAIGHPFAATGARILATAAKQLAERGSGRALISICAAGGMGVTAILER